MRSYNAWNRRPGWRLAVNHSTRWSCLTLSTGFRPSGLLDPVLPVMPSRLLPPHTLSPQGTLPPAALCRTTFVREGFPSLFGTMIPSDFRWTTLDFTFGLYEPS